MAEPVRGMVFEVTTELQKARQETKQLVSDAESGAKRMEVSNRRADTSFNKLEDGITKTGRASRSTARATNDLADKTSEVSRKSNVAALSTAKLSAATSALSSASVAATGGLSGLSAGLSAVTATGSAASAALAPLLLILVPLLAAFTAFRAARSFTSFILDSIGASQAQTQAEQELAGALRARGIATEEVFARLKAFGSEIQALTRYGDEAIVSVSALLIRFGVGADEVEGLATAVTNMAAVTGQDLSKAAILAAKAVGGETSALTRYGISLDKATVKAEGAVAVTQALNQVFSGAAREAAVDYAGRVIQVRNAWGDVQEVTADFITRSPSVNVALDTTSKLLAELTKALTGSKDVMQPLVLITIEFTQNVVILAIGIRELKNEIVSLTDKAPGLGRAIVDSMFPVQSLLLDLTKSFGNLFSTDISPAFVEAAKNSEDPLLRMLALLEEARVNVEALRNADLTTTLEGIRPPVPIPPPPRGPTSEPKPFLEVAPPGEKLEAQSGVEPAIAIPDFITQLNPLTEAVQENFQALFGGLETPLQFAQTQLDDFLTHYTDWTAEYLRLQATAATGNAAFGNAFAGTYQTLDAAANLLDTILGKETKFAQGLRKVQAAQLLVTGVKSLHEGFVKIAKSIWPPNPVELASGVAQVAQGTAAIATARRLGASEGSSGGGGGSAGAGGAAIPTAQSVAPVTPQREITVFVEGSGFVQNLDEFARAIARSVEEQEGRAGV